MFLLYLKTRKLEIFKLQQPVYISEPVPDYRVPVLVLEPDGDVPPLVVPAGAAAVGAGPGAGHRLPLHPLRAPQGSAPTNQVS